MSWRICWDTWADTWRHKTKARARQQTYAHTRRGERQIESLT